MLCPGTLNSKQLEIRAAQRAITLTCTTIQQAKEESDEKSKPMGGTFTG